MQKFIVSLFAIAGSLGLFAAGLDPSPHLSGANFQNENFRVGEEFFTRHDDTNGAPDSAGTPSFWITNDEDDFEGTISSYKNGEEDIKYLDFESNITNPVYRTIKDCYNADSISEATPTNIGKGLFMDTRVKFTPYTVTAVHTPPIGLEGTAIPNGCQDKLVVWLREQEVVDPNDTTITNMVTNLVATAAYFEGTDNARTIKHYELVLPNGITYSSLVTDFHRLTIKAFKNITTSEQQLDRQAGFVVYLDGDTHPEPLEYRDADSQATRGGAGVDGSAVSKLTDTIKKRYYNDTKKCLLPCLILGDAQQSISAVGFSGTGAVSEIYFDDYSTGFPEFAMDPFVFDLCWTKGVKGFKFSKDNGNSWETISGLSGDTIGSTNLSVNPSLEGLMIKEVVYSENAQYTGTDAVWFDKNGNVYRPNAQGIGVFDLNKQAASYTIAAFERNYVVYTDEGEKEFQTLFGKIGFEDGAIAFAIGNGGWLKLGTDVEINEGTQQQIVIGTDLHGNPETLKIDLAGHTIKGKLPGRPTIENGGILEITNSTEILGAVLDSPMDGEADGWAIGIGSSSVTIIYAGYIEKINFGEAEDFDLKLIGGKYYDYLADEDFYLVDNVDENCIAVLEVSENNDYYYYVGKSATATVTLNNGIDSAVATQYSEELDGGEDATTKTYTVLAGTNFTIEYTAKDHYLFVCGEDTTNVTYNITADTEITAPETHADLVTLTLNYDETKVKPTVKQGEDGDVVNPDPENTKQYQVLKGVDGMITWTTKDIWVFVDDGSTEKVEEYNLSADEEKSAPAVKEGTFTVKFEDGEHSTITPAAGTSNIVHGTEITVTATAAENYEFAAESYAGWTKQEDGTLTTNVTVTAAATFKAPDATATPVGINVPDKLPAGVTKLEIYQSSDNGATWTLVVNGKIAVDNKWEVRGTATDGYTVKNPIAFGTAELGKDITVNAEQVNSSVTYTVTVPELVNFTVAVTNGETEVGTTNGVYKFDYNSNVKVVFAAATGYQITADTSTNIASLVENVVIAAPTVALKEFTVTFDLAHDSETIVSNSVPYGTAFEDVKPVNPTWVGYTFKNWTPDGEDVVSNATYTAQWEINKYEVSYTVDGQAAESETVEHGASPAHIPAIPAKTGYAFTGWSPSDPTNAVITCATNFVTTYAAIQYEIIYNYGAGTGPATSNQETYVISTDDQTIHLTAPTPAPGYNFKDFTLKVDRGDDVKIDDGTNLVIKANVIDPISVQANYEAITYTITYLKNGGTGDNLPPSFTVGDENVTVGNVGKEGHTFEGWTCEWLSVPTPNLVFNPREHLGNVTFTANFTINKYDVKFNKNIAAEAAENVNDWPADTNVTWNTTVNTPAKTPTCEGYRFDGWYTTAECTAAFNFTTPIKKDTKIYAKWVKTFKVTFNAGTGIESIKVDNAEYARGDVLVKDTNAVVTVTAEVKTGYEPFTAASYTIVCDTNVTLTTTATPVDISVPAADKLPAGVAELKIYQSSDNGATWTLVEGGKIVVGNQWKVEGTVADGYAVKNPIASGTAELGQAISVTEAQVKSAVTYTVKVPALENFTVEVKSNETAVGTQSGDYKFGYGTKVEVVFAPVTGYQITTDTSTNIASLVENVEIAAPTVEKLKYTVTFMSDGAEYAVSNNVPHFTEFAKVKPADPEKVGFGFTGWTPATELTIVSNTTYTAAYTNLEYVLTLTGGANVATNVNPAEATYHYDDTVTITATPNQHYTFEGVALGAGWGLNESGAATNKVTIAGDTEVAIPNAVPAPVEISVPATAELPTGVAGLKIYQKAPNGANWAEVTDGRIVVGNQWKVEGTSATGYTVQNPIATGTAKLGEAISVEKSAVEAKVTINTYTVTVPELVNFTVAVTNGETEVGTTNGVYKFDYNSNVKVVFAAATGYQITTDTSTNIESLVENVVITAPTVEKIKFDITFTDAAAWTNVVATEYGEVPVAPTAEVPAVTGKSFKGWDTEVVAAFEEATYTAVYTNNQYTLTIPEVEHASAVVSNDTSEVSERVFDYGTKVTVYWTAEAGWKITSDATELIEMTDDKTAAEPVVEKAEITITVKKGGGIESVTYNEKALEFNDNVATLSLPADATKVTLTLAAVSTIKIPVFTYAKGVDVLRWNTTSKETSYDVTADDTLNFAAEEANAQDPAITDEVAAEAVTEAATTAEGKAKVEALTTGEGAVGGKTLANWINTKADGNVDAALLAGNYVKASVKLDVAPITADTAVKVETVEKQTSDLAVTVKIGEADATKEQIESFVELCGDLGAANDWEKLPKSTLKSAVKIKAGKLVITPQSGISKLFLKVVIPADAN